MHRRKLRFRKKKHFSRCCVKCNSINGPSKVSFQKNAKPTDCQPNVMKYHCCTLARCFFVQHRNPRADTLKRRKTNIFQIEKKNENFHFFFRLTLFERNQHWNTHWHNARPTRGFNNLIKFSHPESVWQWWFLSGTKLAKINIGFR